MSPLAALVMAGVVTSCGGSATSDRRPTVAVGVYPLQWLVAQVGGAEVRVVTLGAPGVEPHDLELTQTDAIEVNDADLVMLLHGFQPAVDDAAAALPPQRRLDLTNAITGGWHVSDGSVDPHFWLAPGMMSAAVDVTVKALSRLAPASAGKFRARAEAVKAQLLALNTRASNELSECASRDLVTAHDSFWYFADAFGLRNHPVVGQNPEAEPLPRTQAELAELIRNARIPTIFNEPLAPSRAIGQLAADSGAKVSVLDPIESSTGGRDYLELMASNVAAVKTGLRCRG